MNARNYILGNARVASMRALWFLGWTLEDIAAVHRVKSATVSKWLFGLGLPQEVQDDASFDGAGIARYLRRIMSESGLTLLEAAKFAERDVRVPLLTPLGFKDNLARLMERNKAAPDQDRN